MGVGRGENGEISGRKGKEKKLLPPPASKKKN